MRPCRIELSANALIHNVQQVRQAAPQSQLMAMVKANAYGHGSLWAAQVLADKVDALAVASLEEAQILRSGGCDLPLLILGGFFTADELPLAETLGVWLVVHESWQLKALAEYWPKTPWKIWVKVDSGMHRLGFAPEVLRQVLEYLSAMPQVAKVTLMSHLAQADQPQSLINQTQGENFVQLAKNYQAWWSFGALDWSLCNSAGLFTHPSWQGDWVRPGISLYGSHPLGAGSPSLGLKPVMRLKASIMALRWVDNDQGVGYGHSFVTRGKRLIATVPLGYGDGFPRWAPNGLVFALVRGGQSYPVYLAGRVSMDLITLDVSDVPQVQIGEDIEFWGEHVDLDQIAAACNTIGYTLMTQMTMRPQRCLIA